MQNAVSSEGRLNKSVSLIVVSSLTAFILLSILILWLGQNEFTTFTWLVTGILIASILFTGIYAYGNIKKMLYAGKLLLQNDAKNKAILKNAADGIVTLSQDWTILSYNRTAESLFQYKFEELKGKKIDALLTHQSGVPYEGVEDIQLTNKNQKVTGQRKDGTLFPVHLSLTEVNINSTTILTGVFRDLTEEIRQQEEIEKRTQEIEKQNWIKTAVSQVYEATKGVQDIDALTAILSGVISKLLQASIGTFYLNQRLFISESDELKLYGSYAFKNTTGLSNSFKFGEGLIGQCALEGESIIITDIPEDYIEINSSAGKSKPKEITIIPIKHNKEIIGVMEFGTTTRFNSAQQEFIKEICSSIGIIIKGVVERAKTEELSIEINNQISAINRSNAAIEFDLDGNILSANSLFLDLMGYTLDEIKGKHHKIFVETEFSKSNEYKGFWKELKKGKFKQGEFERIQKDNETVWIQGSYNPILNVDGQPYKVLKVAVDITKQKEQQIKTEELSIEINNQISAINRSNAAIEFDLDGNVLTANELFLDLMGYTIDEIKDKHHKIFVGNAYSKSKEYQEFWKELKVGAFKQGEFERRTKDRKPVWIQGSYNPLLDAEGKPYKILKIAVDITEQKKIQFEVQKQKEIVEAQEEELRVSNEELTKQANQLQASEEELRQQQEELEKANVMLEEKAQQLEEQHLYTVEKNAALEQAQEALVIKTEELEKSGKYKSEFLANMSHELRTPLNSVIILSKLLQDNKSDNLTDKQIEFAQIINKSGEDLLSLINEVLDLAKVESGKIELEIESQNLRSYAEESQKTFIAIAEDKKVNFELNVDDSLPETFSTDKQRLNQVIKNLLSNAFKFTDREGTVTLKFKNSKTLPKFTNPTLLKSEKVLQIAVTDTGIGIAPEKLESVFEAFVQEDGTTQRKYGGTGLGLSISKELVKLLGGEIFVESEIGQGSTFTLFLPFSTPENIQLKSTNQKTSEENHTPVSVHESTLKEDVVAQPVELNTGKKVSDKKLEGVIADDRDLLKKGDKTLLIVEDDLQFAKVLLDQARENGFKVLVTNQGDKALQHVETYLPNAIILDMQLPIMDGWTVLKKLKANEKYAHIPVHVISGIDKTKLGLELGAVEYLVKPIALHTLEQTFSNISKTISGTDVKKVLIIEDDESNNKALQEMVKSKQLEAVAAKNAKDARKLFKNEHPDLVVLDLGLPDIDGIELLDEFKMQKKEVPVIVFTGRELTKKELKQIERHQDTSVVLKTTRSYDRLSEETELFMNMLNSTHTDYKVLPPKEFASEDIIKGKRILIVDDDMRNIYALETVLEEEQVEVTVATNGEEAVDEVRNGEFDAVLMDIMMPVMDGYEATKKIRELGHKKLPIIALTAKAMKGDREKCLEAGVSDYMSKPLDVEKLLSLLRVWLYK
ncbi:response regulator [Flagellimonas pacifica]|uniref:histidine kinase n=1 Tax=Flagellimonas pacifica TaxID=1247520 RepID=A0A285MVT3_9FLAO|nr:response regulator [Allomuricauda parva]SNY99581.1 PAS domain S-box-containing protein [Allomuricauda parva]